MNYLLNLAMKNSESPGSEYYRGNMPQLELSLNENKQMKFTAQKNELLQALNITGRCIGKSVMPIMDNYRFQIAESELTITGSSMEVFICKKIHIESDITELDICVPAKKLLDFIKTLASQPLIFTLKQKEGGSYSMEMKYSTGKFNISTENGSDFPLLPLVESEPITIDNQTLIDGFFKTTFAVDDSSMKVTSNLLMQFGNGIQITGANSFYLSIKKVFDNTINLKTILLPTTAPDILTSLSNSGETNISYSDKNVCFELSDGTKVFSQLMDGKYPEIKGLVQFESDKSVTVNVSEFTSALKRVVMFADLINKQVKINLSEAGITLETANESGESATENVSCEYSGEPFTIGVISDQFNAVMNKVKSETMFMQFLAPNKPIKIMENESDGIDNMFMVIPCVINE